MASLPNAKTVTYEEWLTMPEDTSEVADGCIVIPQPARPRHAPTVEGLIGLLSEQLDEVGLRIVAGSLSHTELSSPSPDVAVVEAATLLPKLFIEVLSPERNRKQCEAQLASHACLGIPEIWIISPEGRTVEILLLENGFLRRSQILAAGILQPKLFPHVQIDIAQIWPD
jgi:Uma2 family endonuclease